MKTIVALLMMTVSGAAAAAQVNKCIDASGKVVAYGAQCPPGTRAEQTGIKNVPAPAQSTQQKSLAERDADFRKRQMEKQEAETKSAKKTAESAEQRRACEQSQAYLKGLQSGQRAARTDPKTGERHYLGDAEYAKELANAQRTAAANCK